VVVVVVVLVMLVLLVMPAVVLLVKAGGSDLRGKRLMPRACVRRGKSWPRHRWHRDLPSPSICDCRDELTGRSMGVCALAWTCE
jgi:hypothetical protein